MQNSRKTAKRYRMTWQHGRKTRHSFTSFDIVDFYSLISKLLHAPSTILGPGHFHYKTSWKITPFSITENHRLKRPTKYKKSHVYFLVYVFNFPGSHVERFIIIKIMAGTNNQTNKI